MYMYWQTVHFKKEVEEQIIRFFKEGKIDELCRGYVISKPNYLSWKSKDGGLEISESKRFKELEDKDSKLKNC